MPMTRPRPPKKSESLEIRIPYPTKQAFMARSRAEGRTASEALRGFIEGHLQDEGASAPADAPRGFTRRLRVMAGILIAAAVGAVALPSLARPGPAPAFERLDANGDGHISAAELSAAFARLDADHDGTISGEEYRRGLAGR